LGEAGEAFEGVKARLLEAIETPIVTAV